MAVEVFDAETKASEILASALCFYNRLDIFIWVACLGPNCRDLLNKGIKSQPWCKRKFYRQRDTLLF